MHGDHPWTRAEKALVFLTVVLSFMLALLWSGVAHATTPITVGPWSAEAGVKAGVEVEPSTAAATEVELALTAVAKTAGCSMTVSVGGHALPTVSEYSVSGHPGTVSDGFLVPAKTKFKYTVASAEECTSEAKYTQAVVEGGEGPAGKEGKEGPAGKEGKEGPAGAEGKAGSAMSTVSFSEGAKADLSNVDENTYSAVIYGSGVLVGCMFVWLCWQAVRPQ